jgi:excisionase family DNA binding protein
MPPCPGHERHDFAGHARCRRPRCRRPRRHWSDYEYGRSRILKDALYFWLRGDLDDAELLDRLTAAFGDEQAQALLTSWTVTRDGCDLFDLLTVDLWQSRRGELRFRVAGRTGWYFLPEDPQDFATDAQALLAEGPKESRIRTWNDEAELLANWSADEGPRLNQQAVPAIGACVYLRLPYPVRWLTTTEAAAQLGFARSHVTHMIRIGHLPAQRPGKDHLVDPLFVAWLAARRKEATH